MGLGASIGPWWGVVGFSLMMLEAIVRLSDHAADGLASAAPGTIALYALCAGGMMYMEGYRGFQKSFSPRFAERALRIRAEPTLLRVIAAPLYCMALFDAPRRRVIVSWLLVVMIVALILVVRQLSQPWRGAVDAGVVAGLSYGLIATLYFSLRALTVGRLK
ncbi:MAG: hypothetical protein ACI8RZ_004769 [Myxococcota bacterium]